MEIPVPPLVIAGRKRVCTGCTAALPSQPCPRAGDAAGTQQPRAWLPGGAALAQAGGLRSGTSPAAAVTHLGQRITAQVPSKINTLDCLKQTGAPGQGKTLTGRATQGLVARPGSSALPDPTASRQCRAGTERDTRGPGGSLGRRTFAPLTKPRAASSTTGTKNILNRKLLIKKKREKRKKSGREGSVESYSIQPAFNADPDVSLPRVRQTQTCSLALPWLTPSPWPHGIPSFPSLK